MQSLLCTMIVFACLNLNTMVSQINMSASHPLLDKIDSSLAAKEQGWKITKKVVYEKSVSYRWESTAKEKVDVFITEAGSPSEAAEALQQRMHILQVGPTATLEGLGDEAYIWKDDNRDTGVIRFRKANLFIEVVASKSAIAERVTHYADD